MDDNKILNKVTDPKQRIDIITRIAVSLLAQENNDTFLHALDLFRFNFGWCIFVLDV